MKFYLVITINFTQYFLLKNSILYLHFFFLFYFLNKSLIQNLDSLIRFVYFTVIKMNNN